MAENTDKSAAEPSRLRRLLLLLPLMLALAFTALAFFRIQVMETGGGDDLPNALQGKAAPRLTLPLLTIASAAPASAPLFDTAQFKGQVTLVNFWGSWCPPCRAEHSFLMELAQNPAWRLVGVNYKDSSENARRFLGSFGNPFRQIGFDQSGRAAIDWGVYGPPETFVLDKNGIILTRFAGPLDAASFRAKILPFITRAAAP